MWAYACIAWVSWHLSKDISVALTLERRGRSASTDGSKLRNGRWRARRRRHSRVQWTNTEIRGVLVRQRRGAQRRRTRGIGNSQRTKLDSRFVLGTAWRTSVCCETCGAGRCDCHGCFAGVVRKGNIAVDGWNRRYGGISSVHRLAMTMCGRSTSNCCRHVVGLRCIWFRRGRLGGGWKRGSA
jgi:hypothetical protein